MFCSNCGNKLNENQKFCTKCGAKINTKSIETVDNNNAEQRIFSPKIFCLSFLVTIILIMLSIGIIHKLAYTDLTIGGDISNQEQTENQNPPTEEENASEVKEPQTPAEKLLLIDEYQVKYFKIIRRNDALLDIIGNSDCERDIDELKKLFKEVEGRIHNNYYLNKYNEIQERFAENPGETTVDMNIFASQNYDAVDELLNEVYQAVKKKIPAQDFKNLTTSEIKWIKDVESYKKVYDSKGFGSIGTLKYYDYEINMRNFRTLLLMLYL